MTLTMEQQVNLGMVEPAAPAPPPTNAQRAAHICHQGGVRAFVPLVTELLDRITELEASNTRLHTRCADLELAETQRQARRKDKSLMATTT